MLSHFVREPMPKLVNDTFQIESIKTTSMEDVSTRVLGISLEDKVKCLPVTELRNLVLVFKCVLQHTQPLHGISKLNIGHILFINP